MKTKDIKVGEEYAVGRDDYPHRARVLEVGTFESTVYDTSFYRGRKVVKHGAQVVYLRKDTGEDSTKINYGTGTEEPHIEWVQSSKVLRTWSEQLIIDKSRREYEARKRDAQDGLRRDVQIIVDCLQSLGLYNYEANGYVDQHLSTNLKLTSNGVKVLKEVLLGAIEGKDENPEIDVPWNRASR